MVMSRTFLKSKSLIQISIVTMLVLANLGWIYSYFPENWFKPMPLLNMVAIESFTIALIVGAFWPVIIPSFILALAVARAKFKDKAPRSLKKYALLLVPLLPATLMVVWGSYCCIHPNAAMYWQEDVTPSPDWFEGLWIDSPWYAKVIEGLFFSSLVYLSCIAYYLARANEWKGERLVAFCILANGALWNILAFKGGVVMASRPPF